MYEVLEKFMEGESEKSDRYVAKYVPFFQTQLGFVDAAVLPTVIGALQHAAGGRGNVLRDGKRQR